MCAKPLLDLVGVIEPEYVTAIIEQHHALGPYYYVLARAGHAACAAGGRRQRTQLSLLKLKQGVSFGAGEFDL